MEKTIIALFCYKRAAKLKASVEALLKNPECASMDVIFFSDGYRGEKDKPGVLATRAYINSVTGFRNVYKHFRDKNLTSAPNFHEGINYLSKNYERFIAIEDDLIVTPNYIRYMLDGLDYYEKHPAVFCITGYCFPLTKKDYAYDSIIYNRFCSYGWASWSCKIQQVVWDSDELKQRIQSSPDFRTRLNREGLDLFRTLKKQLNGTISAWDILMQVHVAENELKVVYPVVSKVCNIGFDKESTNTFGVDYLKTETDKGDKRDFKFCHPDETDYSLQQQLKKPYSLPALAIRKLANTILRLTALWSLYPLQILQNQA
jgi:hypothetical protein